MNMTANHTLNPNIQPPVVLLVVSFLFRYYIFVYILFYSHILLLKINNCGYITLTKLQ